MKKFLCNLFFIFLSFVALKAQYTVTFIVKNAHNYEPINGAQIDIENNGSISTNNEGVATITLPYGVYTYIVTKPGFQNHFGSISVYDNFTEYVYLTPESSNSYNVVFYIADENNNPIQNAQINILNYFTLYSDEYGGASCLLLEGNYEFVVNANGFLSYHGSFSLTTDLYIEVILSSLHNVTFNLTSNNTPLTNFKFFLKNQNLELIDTLITDTVGQAFTNLPNGLYYYKIDSSGFVTIEEQFVIAGHDTVININVQPWPQLTIYVFDEDEDPLAGINVIILDSLQQQIDTLLTNDQGSVTIQLDRGLYYCFINHHHYFPHLQQIYLNNDTIIHVNLRYLPIVSFWVYDENNNFLGDAKIRIYQDTQLVATLFSFNFGGVSVYLMSGQYSYIVEKDGFFDVSGSFTVENSNLEININLYLKRTANFVVSYNDLPLSGAQIFLYNSNYFLVANLQTDNAGFCSIQLVKGLYHYYVHAIGHPVNTGSFDLTSLDTTFYITISAIKEIYSQIFYPNPANDVIIFNNLNQNTYFELYDLRGILVKKFYAKKNDILDISNLKSGLYILRFGNIVQKLIKQ